MAGLRKYPVVPKRPSGSNPPRFPMFGAWISALRKRRQLDQEEVARRAGISIDQVGRLERGDNVGVWYAAAVIAALDEAASVVGEERGIVAALVSDGRDVRGSEVLQERLKREDPLQETGQKKTSGVGRRNDRPG